MMQTLNEEEKKKRRAIVIAIGAVMIVAAVGVGFAVNYLGSADNTSNDNEAVYYIVSLDSNMDGLYDQAADFTDAFSGRIYFDNVNTSEGVTYTPHTELIDSQQCALLGTVNVKVHGPAGLSVYDDYVLSLTHGSALTKNYKYTVTTGGNTTAGDFASAADQGLTINATGAQETIYTISLYVVIPSPMTGTPQSYTFADQTFSFEVTATA